MKWKSTLLWFLVCCMGYTTTLPVDGNKPLDIWCLDDYVRAQDDLMENVGNDIQNCESKEIFLYPFSEGAIQTPAAPESISVKVMAYNTSDDSSTVQLALFISWLYKRKYFRPVEQFHIEMNFLDVIGLHKQFVFSWGDDLQELTDNSTARFLRFHYIYAWQEDGFQLRPRNEIVLRLQGLPMYAEDAEPQDVSKTIVIPSCQTKEVRKSQACATARRCKPEQVHVDGMCFKPETRKRPRKTFKETTTSVPPLSVTWTFKSPHLIVAVTGGSVVIAALVFLYLWFYRKKFCAAYTDTPLERKKTRILLVCTIDNGFVDAINQLIEMIMKLANVEVTCNLRKKTEIGMHGIQEWTKKEVGNSDITCVVVANRYETMKLDMEENETSRLDDVEKHQIAIVIAAIETMIVNNAFENTMKKFIVLDLSSCVDKESLPYFTRYKLPSDLKKFMKSIPSKMTKSQKMKIDKEQKIFLNLLSNAQLGYSHTFQTYDDEEKIAISDSECSQSGQANDFDDIEKEETSLDVGDSRHGNAISLNIVPSAPHSHECNTKMYETTDYNHRSVIEQQRFIQSGARPKQTNC